MQAETRYHPSAEQLEIVGAVDESLAEVLPLARLHAAGEEDEATWAGLEAIGVFGIRRSEAQGGSGLGMAEEALIVVSLGRRLASPAVLATLGAQSATRVAAAYRHDHRIVLIEEPQAETMLLREAQGAALYALPGKTAPIEQRLWLARLSQVPQLGEPIARYDQAQLLRLRLLDAAALAGIAQASLDMAVAYAGLREQFGRPIGTFQAIKHHCADMAIAARCARDQVSFAAVALDEQRPDAEVQIESALLVAGQAALDNAGRNIQIHGGIGFSDEADPHLFLKRAQLQLAIAGGLEAAATRLAHLQVQDS